VLLVDRVQVMIAPRVCDDLIKRDIFQLHFDLPGERSFEQSVCRDGGAGRSQRPASRSDPQRYAVG
jgi:hypothetical protein